MTNQTIYVVAYGQHKVADKEYADGFRIEYCEGIALGAFTDKAIAEAVAFASERGFVTSVPLDSVNENHRAILEDTGQSHALPNQTRLEQIENLAYLLNEKSTMQGKDKLVIAEEIISAIERRVLK